MDQTKVSEDQHLLVTVGDLCCTVPIRDSAYPNTPDLRRKRNQVSFDHTRNINYKIFSYLEKINVRVKYFFFLCHDS